MRNTIILLIGLAALTAQGINITNYPLTNTFGAGEWFLLSSPSQATNFNLPGNYVAKAVDLYNLSNTVAALPGGLTVTQKLALSLDGSLTNVAVYTNLYVGGLLAASGPFAPPSHGPSLILPGGGYLTQPGGGTLLLP